MNHFYIFGYKDGEPVVLVSETDDVDGDSINFKPTQNKALSEEFEEIATE